VKGSHAQPHGGGGAARIARARRRRRARAHRELICMHSGIVNRNRFPGRRVLHIFSHFMHKRFSQSTTLIISLVVLATNRLAWKLITQCCGRDHPHASDDACMWRRPDPKKDSVLAVGFAIQRGCAITLGAPPGILKSRQVSYIFFHCAVVSDECTVFTTNVQDVAVTAAARATYEKRVLTKLSRIVACLVCCSIV
jgi:hypothetical protein